MIRPLKLTTTNGDRCAKHAAFRVVFWSLCKDRRARIFGDEAVSLIEFKFTFGFSGRSDAVISLIALWNRDRNVPKMGYARVTNYQCFKKLCAYKCDLFRYEHKSYGISNACEEVDER